MYRKLKLKLILVNIAVMIVLFLLTAGGIYFLMQEEISWQSRQVMQLVLSEAQLNTKNAGANQVWQNNRYFYVKTNPSHQIIGTSPGVSLDPDQIKLLVEKVFLENKSEGETRWDQGTYHFVMQPLAGRDQGYIFAFENTGHKEEMLNFLLTALIIIGLIGLFLAFFSGRYMARIAMEPVNQSWQRQKDFVANASHELRTPLSVIQTNLEVVRSNSQETVASQGIWLDNVQAEALRMAGLVNDLLFLARADVDERTMEMKKFSLNQMLEETIRPFQAMAAKKNIGLDLFIEAPVMFCGDETKIKQLVVILIDNGLRYTPPSGCVSVKLEDDGSSISITVSDTGEGIKKEHLEKIFQRFYRVDQSRVREERGTGLGLAIAKWIVENHHGKIQVNSTIGKGTSFLVTLPKSKSILYSSQK